MTAADPPVDTLHVWTRSGRTLLEVVTDCKDVLAGGVALLATPPTYRVACVTTAGTLATPDDELQPTNPRVYEARIFTADSELRWLSLPGESPAAALLTTIDLTTADTIPDGWSQDDPIEPLKTLARTYLLWGTAAKKQLHQADGWTMLTTARIGHITVPLAPPSQAARVHLTAVEYLQVVDRHGNTAVVEERLTGLHAIKEPSR